MAIARLGAMTPGAGGITAPGTPVAWTVPAGGIPVDARIIIAGFIGRAIAPSDSKANTWTVRANASGGIITGVLADCLVTTALVSGDTIVTNAGVGPFWAFSCIWQSKSYFESVALGPRATSWTGTAAVAPAVTTKYAGNLIIGGFLCEAGSSPVPTLTAAGAGYTDEIGVTGSSSPDGIFNGYDWVSKIGSAAGSEQPSGTMNAAGTYRTAFTAVYTETLVPNIMGVV